MLILSETALFIYVYRLYYFEESTTVQFLYSKICFAIIISHGFYTITAYLEKINNVPQLYDTKNT